MEVIKIHNRGASVMAIFICILKNQLGMEGSTRKDCKGLL